MTEFPFEDDAKASLRGRCTQAIESAAYTVQKDLIDIVVPSDLNINGVLRGDIQATTTGGCLHVYMLRPDPSKTLPGWAQNYAPALSRLDDIEIYIVVPDTHRVIEQSCRSLGYGLLSLNADNTFRGIIEFTREAYERNQQELLDEVRVLRRRLEFQSEKGRTIIRERIIESRNLAANLNEQQRQEFLEFVDPALDGLDSWNQQMSQVLDRIQESPDRDAIARMKKVLTIGYTEPD